VTAYLFHSPASLVIQAEQRDDSRNVAVAGNAVTDPTGSGKNVMNLGFSSRDELLSHGYWKRQICEAIAMQMAEFTPSNAKLDTTIAMR